jgi:hypothetical protein
MLETEADLLRPLRSGTYTLDELYAPCETTVDVARDDGQAPVSDRHRTDSVWKHRVRGWLANAKAKGLAERVDRATWLIQGTAENPSRLVLLNAGGDLAGVELCVQDAVALLHSLEEPADLVLCDPPYSLGRGAGHFADGHGYRRDQTRSLTATSTSTRPPTRSSPFVGSARPPRSSATVARSPSSPAPAGLPRPRRSHQLARYLTLGSTTVTAVGLR